MCSSARLLREGTHREHLLREDAGLKMGDLPVPPSLLAIALRFTNRRDLWDKISGDLVVSVEKLRSIGFRWKVESPQALRALGAICASELKRARRV